jgi:hypothetical protein
MNIAAILLGLAALGGGTIAILRLRGMPRPPTWMALAHGTVAAAGLITLIYIVATTTVPGLTQIALGVLVIAALGGATLFLGFHLREQPLPIPLVLGHGLIAVIGFSLLLISMYRTS